MFCEKIQNIILKITGNPNLKELNFRSHRIYSQERIIFLWKNLDSTLNH